MRPVDFFEQYLRLPFTNGEPFKLLDWQREVLTELFGEGGSPLLRTYYLSTAKKSSKTTLGAGLCLYFLIAEPHEPAARIYSAASDKEQAQLLWDAARQMIELSPELKRLEEQGKLIVQRDNIIYRAKNGERIYQSIAMNEAGSHGLNASVLLIDELHAIRGTTGREFLSSLTKGSIARRSPLTFFMTTAGTDLTSYCFELEERIRKMEQGLIEKPKTFGHRIYRADPKLPWDSEDAFAAANPSYGITVGQAAYVEHVTEARQSPVHRRSYEQLFLNRWTQRAEGFIDLQDWDACADTYAEDHLLGRECDGGLDLSKRLDLTAFALTFPPTPEDPYYRTLAYSFLPRQDENDLRCKELKDGVPYFEWARQGWLDLTEGRVIDQNHIVETLIELSKKFSIRSIAYDPNLAHEIVKRLNDAGLHMVEMRQWYSVLSEPTNELLAQTVSHRIRHNGNPVLKWNVSNLTIETGKAGQIMPSKSKSREKIDVAVALIMSLGRAVNQEKQEPFVSVYENRGILFL